MTCNAWIEHNPAITYAFARHIDSILHGPIPYTPDDQLSLDPSVRLAVQTQEFIEHQRTILALVDGCELEIFNDPRVFYTEDKPHLSGPTGSMSTLLTNGFVYLYKELLTKVPSLTVNADVDLLLLLNLVKHSPEMPEEELANVTNLAYQLYPRRTTNICTPEWYSNYTNTIIQVDDLLLETYPWYIYGDPLQKLGVTVGVDFLRGYSDKPDDQSQEKRTRIKRSLTEAEQHGYIFSSPYRLWETRPPYAVLSPPVLEGYDADTLVSKSIPFLRTVLPPLSLD